MLLFHLTYWLLSTGLVSGLGAFWLGGLTGCILFPAVATLAYLIAGAIQKNNLLLDEKKNLLARTTVFQQTEGSLSTVTPTPPAYTQL